MRILSGFVFVLLAFLLSFVASAKTVTDYYLEVPGQFLSLTSDVDGHEFSRSERLSFLSIQDNKNGFLKIKSDKLTADFTIALFKLKDRTDLIGIIEDGASVQQPIRFVTLENGVWVDVTSKVFPKVSKDYVLKRYQAVKPSGRTYTKKILDQASHSLVRYSLPREGKAIMAYAGIEDDGESKQELFRIKFDGSKFKLNP